MEEYFAQNEIIKRIAEKQRLNTGNYFIFHSDYSDESYNDYCDHSDYSDIS